jgi:hypothetical protein
MARRSVTCGTGAGAGSHQARPVASRGPAAIGRGRTNGPKVSSCSRWCASIAGPGASDEAASLSVVCECVGRTPRPQWAVGGTVLVAMQRLRPHLAWRGRYQPPCRRWLWPGDGRVRARIRAAVRRPRTAEPSREPCQPIWVVDAPRGRLDNEAVVSPPERVIDPILGRRGRPGERRQLLRRQRRDDRRGRVARRIASGRALGWQRRETRTTGLHAPRVRSARGLRTTTHPLPRHRPLTSVAGRHDGSLERSRVSSADQSNASRDEARRSSVGRPDGSPPETRRGYIPPAVSGR